MQYQKNDEYRDLPEKLKSQSYRPNRYQYSQMSQHSKNHQDEGDDRGNNSLQNKHITFDEENSG